MAYAMLVQKQPGAKPCQVISRLDIADNYQKIWQYGEKADYNEPDGWEIKTQLDRDRYWAAVLVNK